MVSGFQLRIRPQLFREDEMVCTCTLYNMVWAGLLPLTPTELAARYICVPSSTY